MTESDSEWDIVSCKVQWLKVIQNDTQYMLGSGTLSDSQWHSVCWVTESDSEWDIASCNIHWHTVTQNDTQYMLGSGT